MAARSAMVCMTVNAVNESRPDVGSSRINKSGLFSSSTPMDTLFLSPPEIPLIRVSPMKVC